MPISVPKSASGEESRYFIATCYRHRHWHIQSPHPLATQNHMPLDRECLADARLVSEILQMSEVRLALRYSYVPLFRCRPLAQQHSYSLSSPRKEHATPVQMSATAESGPLTEPSRARSGTALACSRGSARPPRVTIYTKYDLLPRGVFIFISITSVYLIPLIILPTSLLTYPSEALFASISHWERHCPLHISDIISHTFPY